MKENGGCLGGLGRGRAEHAWGPSAAVLRRAPLGAGRGRRVRSALLQAGEDARDRARGGLLGERRQVGADEAGRARGDTLEVEAARQAQPPHQHLAASRINRGVF